MNAVSRSSPELLLSATADEDDGDDNNVVFALQSFVVEREEEDLAMMAANMGRDLGQGLAWTKAVLRIGKN